MCSMIFYKFSYYLTLPYIVLNCFLSSCLCVLHLVDTMCVIIDSSVPVNRQKVLILNKIQTHKRCNKKCHSNVTNAPKGIGLE